MLKRFIEEIYEKGRKEKERFDLMRLDEIEEDRWHKNPNTIPDKKGGRNASERKTQTQVHCPLSFPEETERCWKSRTLASSIGDAGLPGDGW
jgi:hypothetical protein